MSFVKNRQLYKNNIFFINLIINLKRMENTVFFHFLNF